MTGIDLSSAMLLERASELAQLEEAKAVNGVEALTASELRVTRRAAYGCTNRAIAQELFVTMKAVEKHLASAYRKLDIQGRGELAEALDTAAG